MLRVGSDEAAVICGLVLLTFLILFLTMWLNEMCIDLFICKSGIIMILYLKLTG